MALGVGLVLEAAVLAAHQSQGTGVVLVPQVTVHHLEGEVGGLIHGPIPDLDPVHIPGIAGDILDQGVVPTHLITGGEGDTGDGLEAVHHSPIARDTRGTE